MVVGNRETLRLEERWGSLPTHTFVFSMFVVIDAGVSQISSLLFVVKATNHTCMHTIPCITLRYTYVKLHSTTHSGIFTLNCMLARYIYICVYIERERGQPPLGARAFGFGQRSSCAKPGMRFATVPGRFDRDVELENIRQESLGIPQNCT